MIKLCKQKLILLDFIKSGLKSYSTMKVLNVAEKNDAAKTISGLLSNGRANRREGYSVYNKIYEFSSSVLGNNADMIMTSVSGHLLNYAFSPAYKNWEGCDPLVLFSVPVHKTCPPDFDKIKQTIEREIRKCSMLIIWTDCDREGENIGFEIIKVCKDVKPSIRVYRAKFSEITSQSVRRALENLCQPDERQSTAVDIRSELDLRIGAAYTRFQTLRFRHAFPNQIEHKLVSYGSCQIPTLGFVVQRYNESEQFISQQFWKLKVIHTINDITVDFNWNRYRLFDKTACEAFLMICQASNNAIVTNVQTKPKQKWRPTAMDTIQLEKLGSRKLKLSAKETMTVAEKLYTKGLISYPRTETNIFSKEIKLRELVEHQTSHPIWGGFARKVLDWGTHPRNGTKSDEAHPPIHPTKLSETSSLSQNEARVYELICRHFLACVSKDACGAETTVNINIADEEFTATGLCIHEKNYLEVYIYEKWNAREIHLYRVGDSFTPTSISINEGSTTAPSMLTEAELIALMDKHGIGTDATHAEHINTIKERDYIGEINGGYLVPGKLGMGLVEGYDAINLPLAQPKLRAELERDLKGICDGTHNPNEVLRIQIEKYKEAYIHITEQALALDESMGRRLNQTPMNVPLATASRMEIVCTCPKCKESMLLRTKKDSTDFYIGCSNFPECKNALWFPNCIKHVSVNTDEKCPVCRSNLITVKFRNNSYLAMLPASENFYKCCIVCDKHFHTVIGINANPILTTNTSTSDLSTVRNFNSSTVPSSNLHSHNSNSTRNINSNHFASRISISGNSISTRNVNSNIAPSSISTSINNISARNINSNTMPQSNILSSNSSNTGNYNRNNNSSQNNRGWGVIPESTNPNNINPSNSHSQFPRNTNSNVNTPRIDNTTINPPRSNSNNSRAGWNLTDDQNQIPMPRSALDNTDNNEDNVNCPKCGQLATKLIVKKDGANKGRPFFKCSNGVTTCNFFQWADLNTVPPSAPSSTNTFNRPVGGSSNRPPSRPTNTNDRNRAAAKRKCGICRQEGHTKNKCPRRTDFE